MIRQLREELAASNWLDEGYALVEDGRFGRPLVDASPPVRIFLRWSSFGQTTLPKAAQHLFGATHRAQPLLNILTRTLVLLPAQAGDPAVRALSGSGPSGLRYVRVAPALRQLGFVPCDADSLALPWRIERGALVIGPFPQPDQPS